MADKEWVTVQPDLSKLLEPVNAVIAMIDSVLAALIAILNIVQTILNVIKAFLLGLLDPIRAIIEAIIQEIRNIINDLKNLGIYLTGDWGLMKSPFLDLKGGFSAFERRMLRKLLDSRDPDRPDFTTSSGVVAIFLYLSAQDIGKLIEFILRLLKFFGQSAEVTPFPAPKVASLSFGTKGPLGLSQYTPLSEQSFASGNPDSVKVEFSIPPPRGFFGFTPQPKGFIIEVGVHPEGQKIVARLPRDGTSNTPSSPSCIWRPATDPTTSGVLTTFSSASLLGPDEATLSQLNRDSPQANGLFMMTTSNASPAPFSTMATRPGANGVAFYVKSGFLSSVLPSQKFNAVIPFDRLPEKWEFDNSGLGVGFSNFSGPYFVRVRAVGNDIADWIKDNPPSRGSGTQLDPYEIRVGELPLFNFTENVLNSAKTGLLKPDPPPLADNLLWTMSPPGAAVEFKAPHPDLWMYISTVQTAVLVTILGRLDFASGTFWNDLDPGEQRSIGVGPPAAGFPGGAPISRNDVFSQNTVSPTDSGTAAGYPESMRQFAQKAFPLFDVKPKYFEESDPLKFRKKISYILRRVARNLIESGPPTDEIIELVVDNARKLTLVTFLDLINQNEDGAGTPSDWGGTGSDNEWLSKTLLDGLEDQTSWAGIGANPMCRSLPEQELNFWYGGAGAQNPAGSDTYGAGPVRPMSFMDSDGALKRRAWGSPFSAFVGVTTAPWMMGQGSGDFSPVLYSNKNDKPIIFFRNLILGQRGQELMNAASEVLQMAGAGIFQGSGDTNWIAVRFLGDSLVPLEELLDKIERFLMAILDALKGLIDQIIAYIEAIQARIYQLQALINAIRALLNALSMFALPSLSGLVLVEAGTSGIISGLLTATNKPVDSPSAYGAGVAVVAGGLPLILLELIAAIFPPEESE